MSRWSYVVTVLQVCPLLRCLYSSVHVFLLAANLLKGDHLSPTGQTSWSPWLSRSSHPQVLAVSLIQVGMFNYSSSSSNNAPTHSESLSFSAALSLYALHPSHRGVMLIADRGHSASRIGWEACKPEARAIILNLKSSRLPASKSVAPFCPHPDDILCEGFQLVVTYLICRQSAATTSALVLM